MSSSGAEISSDTVGLAAGVSSAELEAASVGATAGGNIREAVQEKSGTVAELMSGEKGALASVPDQLTKMYLQGLISKGELIYHLKAYNTVTADTILREQRHNTLSAVDYRGEPVASMSKPGADLAPPSPQEETDAYNEQSVGARASDGEDPEEHKRQQQQEEQEQRREQVWISMHIEELNSDAIESHQHAEDLRLEEEENLQPPPPVSPIDYLGHGELTKGHSVKLGTIDSLRASHSHKNSHKAKQQDQLETEGPAMAARSGG